MKINNNYKCIYLFFILVFIIQFINNVDAQLVSEYECLSYLVVKFGITDFQLNATGGYTFCIKDDETYSKCDNNGNILSLFLYTKNTQTIIINDIECLPNLTTLSLMNGFQVSEHFFYHQFNNIYSIIYSNSIFQLNSIDKILPGYDSIIIISYSFQSSILKMSMLNNVRVFSLLNSYVTLEIDGVANRLRELEVNLKSIPDFTSHNKLFKLSITITTGFDETTYSNISTVNTSYFYITSTALTFPHSIISQQPPFTLTYYINGDITSPTEIIDLKDLPTQILLISNAPSFNINGLYPLLGNNQTYVQMSYCKISSFMPTSQFENQQYVKITNSSVDGEMGVYNKSQEFKSLDFSLNNISGTIDSSWCSTEIQVTDNELSGTIPSCFRCYFDSPFRAKYLLPMMDRFKDNLFTNFIGPYVCTTFKPNVTVDPYGIKLYGTDIGFDSRHWLLKGVDKCLGTSIIELGKSYFCVTPYPTTEYFKGQDYFSILFIHPGNRSITFPLITHKPIIHSIIRTEMLIVITGLFFSSYDGYTDQYITWSSSKLFCLNIYSDFYRVECSTAAQISTTENQSFTITTNGQTKTILFNDQPKFVNDKQCPNDCSGGLTGICNMGTGICLCQNGIDSDDCTEYPCPTNSSTVICSNHGTCNNSSGKCACDSKSQGDDCSTPFKDCASNCGAPLLHGSCYNVTGECLCVIGKWSGVDCSTMVHFISSIDQTDERGGNATIYGGFGDAHTNISLTIGGKVCNITFISSTVIICTALPGTGLQTAILYQNNLESKYIYNYRPINLSCLNDCTSPLNGVCNSTTGICKCLGSYFSHDCSIIHNGGNGNGGNSTIDEGTGSTNLTDKSINFQIYFNSLKEVDVNNNVIKQYPLNRDWTLNKTVSNIYNFKQTINGTRCIVTSVIEEIVEEKGKEFTFAGTIFNIDQGSIKFTISIANYSYSSNLNTLQLELISSVDQIQNDDNCNSKETEIDTSNVNDKSSFNYIKISKNNKILSGRFINKVISDGRPTFFSTSVTNNTNSIIVTLSLPHCVDECVIDPDFSVLVSPNFKSECDVESNNRKWVLPVAIIVSVVGAAIILTATILIYKKSTALKVLIHGSKLKKLNK